MKLNNKYWYYDNSLGEQGPFSIEEIKFLIKENKIHPTVLMREESLGQEYYEARQINQVKKLFSDKRLDKIPTNKEPESRLADLVTKFGGPILILFFLISVLSSDNFKKWIDNLESSEINEKSISTIDFSDAENVKKLYNTEKILKSTISQYRNTGKSKGDNINDLEKIYGEVVNLKKRYLLAKELGKNLNLKSFATIEEISIGSIKKVDNAIDKEGKK